MYYMYVRITAKLPILLHFNIKTTINVWNDLAILYNYTSKIELHTL